jgi:hypothetical protein
MERLLTMDKDQFIEQMQNDVRRILGRYQRVITPLAVIADVHPFLALAGRGGDRAVGVDDRLPEELRVLLFPEFQADFVDRLHQDQDQDLPLVLESSAKSPAVVGSGIRCAPNASR